MVITARQESLVVSSWNEMKDDALTYGLKLFLKYIINLFFPITLTYSFASIYTKLLYYNSSHM